MKLKKELFLKAFLTVVLAVGLTACQSQISLYEMGTVDLTENTQILFHQQNEYWQSQNTEDGFLISRINSQTGQTIMKAWVDSNMQPTDAVWYDNRLFLVLAGEQKGEQETIPYQTVFLSGGEVTQLTQGSVQKDTSLLPRFFLSENGLYLAEKNGEQPPQLYTLKQHSDMHLTPIQTDWESEFISITPKVWNNKAAFFTQQNGQAEISVSEINKNELSSKTVYRIGIEQNADLIDYAITEKYLLVCQQTPNSRQNSENAVEYELVLWDLQQEKEIKRKSLHNKPFTAFTAVQTNQVLCRDINGELNCISLPDLAAKPQPLPEIGQTNTAIFGQGEQVFRLDTQSGKRFSVTQSMPPVANPPIDTDVSLSHGQGEEHLQKQGTGIGLESTKAEPFEGMFVKQLTAFWESQEEQPSYYTMKLEFDQKEYLLQAEYHWQNKELQFYEITATDTNQQIPSEVAEKINETTLLATAESLFEKMQQEYVKQTT